MKDIIISLLIVAGILLVCGTYFKLVIQRWLASDSATGKQSASGVLAIEVAESQSSGHASH